MAAPSPPFKNPITSKSSDGGDRFIPNRPAMDLDMVPVSPGKDACMRVKENTAPVSPAKDTHRRALVDTMMPNRGQILACSSQAPLHAQSVLHDIVSDDSVAHQAKLGKPERYIPQSAEYTLDGPDILDDYSLNPLDWGSSNVLSIALGNTVNLRNAFDGSTSELVTSDER